MDGNYLSNGLMASLGDGKLEVELHAVQFVEHDVPFKGSDDSTKAGA